MADADSGPDEGPRGEPPPKRAKQDAFAELMAPKPSNSKPTATASKPTRHFKNRMALGAYIADPASYPPSTVICHSEDFVVVHDKFPKATVHALLLPRSPRHTLLHPFDALQHDAEFRGKVQAEAEELRRLVATELQRRLGRFSRADAARQAVLDGDAEPPPPAPAAAASDDHEAASSSSASAAAGVEPELPPGRDWAAEVICGVHASPSMGNLHVHVLSRDMHSPALKHRKHYNSFNTPFLVDVADFPLAAGADLRGDDAREGGGGYLRRDLRCWRCGRNFGNRFKELKEHLEAEFEEWKRQ